MTMNPDIIAAYNYFYALFLSIHDFLKNTYLNEKVKVGFFQVDLL